MGNKALPPTITAPMKMPNLIGLAAAVALVLTASCLNLRRDCVATSTDPECKADAGVSPTRAGGGPGPDDNAGGNGGHATSDAPDAPGSLAENPDAPSAPVSDPGCQPGFHTCGGICVDSKLPNNCGMACEPCPTATGGSSTCDGVKCGVACPDGKKVCAALGQCIGVDEPCGGTCPAGKNPCNGLCVDTNSTTACGAACTVCPTAANGTTVCDGMQCSLTCAQNFHRCGDQCLGND
jgi:hypothetical protein